MVTGRDEIKLIDFGIARTFQTKQQATVIMTLGYAPPEQLHGMAEPRSDLYALGATIHRVLTGHDAANNKPNIFSFPPVRTLRPDITPAFEQILMRALAPNLEQRWPDALEMERALANLPPIGGAGPHQARVTGGVPSLTTNPMAGTGPRSTTGAPSSHTATGPAGMYITAAQSHLTSNPPRLVEAEHAIKQAHLMEPNNSQVHKIFGRIFAHRHNVSNAISAYTRSLELYRDDPETHKLLGDVWLYLHPNYPQAIAAYAQSLRLKADDFETHERIAICYEKTGQLDLALRDFQEAVRLAVASSRPQAVLVRLQVGLGHAAWRLRQLPQAETAFVQALFLNASDHQTRFLLAQVYEQEGKLAEALRECSYVLGPLGNNPMVHQMYHRLRQRLGQ
jgi:Flp pilus assembly protein TadD